MPGCCPTYLALGPLLFWGGVAAVCGCAQILTGQALFLVTRGTRGAGRWRELLAVPLLAVGCWALGLAAVTAATYWTFEHDPRYTPRLAAPDVTQHVDLALAVFSRLGVATALVAAALLLVGRLALIPAPRSRAEEARHG
jgi:hypothetical protein